MDYKLDHQVSEGESYTRCNQIIIDNRRDAPPAVTFGQERVVVSGGQHLHIPMAPLPLTFDPAATIPIVSPETGEATGGTITQAEIYALIYSAYIYAATQPPTTESEA